MYEQEKQLGKFFHGEKCVHLQLASLGLSTCACKKTICSLDIKRYSACCCQQYNMGKWHNACLC